MNPQQGVNLGSAYGQIVISDNIDSALGNAQRAFDNALSGIGQRMQSVGQTMSNVGSQISIATAPLAIFGAQGIRAASRYEDAMKEIEVRAGLTAEQMAVVADKTEEIGIRSQYGPAQAADAFLQLLSSGSSVEEAMLQIDSVINGASASGLELGFVADALTDVMASFGLEASQSADVMQSLIDATGSSSATLTDLVDGFANVGPAAMNAGLSIDETAAALAVFAENGIKGSEGGTQLKTVLTQLQSPRAADELERLGVTIADMDGNIRPLNDIIVDLNSSMDGMSEIERNQAIQELVGSYGQLGLSALLAEGGIDEMLATMDEQAAIADIAAARMETFSGSVAFTQGSIELLQIRALRPFMENTLRPLILMIGDVVNKISDWVVANPELAQQIIRVLAVVTALGPVLIVVGQAISIIGGALVGLSVLLGIVLSPIGLLIAGVVALGVAFATNFKGIRDTLLPIVDSLIGTFNQLFNIFAFRDFVGGGLLAEDGPVTDMLFNFRDAVLAVGDTLRGVFERVISAVLPAITEISTFISNNLEGIISFALTVFQVGQTLLALTTPLGQLGIVMRLFGVDLLAIFESVMGGVTRFFASLNSGQSIVEALRAAFNDSDFFNAIVSGFESVSSFVTDTLLPALQSFRDWFVGDGLPGALSYIQGTAVGVFEQLKNSVLSIWTMVQPYLQSLYDWFVVTALPAIQAFIVDTAIPAVQSLIDTLIMVWEDVSPFLTFLADWFLTTVFPMVMDFITNTALPVIQSLIDILMSIWETVSPALGSMYEWFVETGLPAIQEFIEGPVTTAIQSFIDILAGIWLAVSGGLTALRDNWEEIFQWIIDYVVQPVIDVVNNLLGLFDGVGQAAQDAANAASDALGNPGQTVNQLGSIGNAVNSGQISAGEVIGMFGREFGNAFGFAEGANVIPRDMFAMVHAGEAIIPSDMNPYNPNATQASGVGSGIQITIGNITASGYEQGQAAGAGFSDELMRRLRDEGYSVS